MASLPTTPTTPRTPGTPSTPGFNTKSPTIKRILQESRELSLHPDPSLTASPLETNLFEWHFTIAGPPSTPYEGGIYHGRIVLPSTYPLRPPSFRFLTPSGRFEVNREICLSISGHHEETWQPAWGIRTALCAIRAFMSSEARGQVGGLDMNEQSRKLLARESKSWKCTGCGGRSNDEIIAECEALWQERSGDGTEDRSRPEVKIPEELRLAYKDDMERGPPTPNIGKYRPSHEPGPASAYGSAQPHIAVTSESAAALPQTLRAGPVASLLARSKPPPSPLRATASASEPEMPPTSVQAPTATKLRSVSPGPTTSSTSASKPALLASNLVSSPSSVVHQSGTNFHQDNVPPWVDKAIIGLILGLALMAIKKLAT